jgi:hypothetical protein
MTTTVTAAPASPTSRAAAFALRTSFIHDQRASEKIFAVERRDCFLSFRVVANFRKAESARLAGEAIAQQGE